MSASNPPSKSRPLSWSLALHGGAGASLARLSAEERCEYEAGMRHALEKGRAVLERGGEALDAVEQTVAALEDHPAFNAGRGSSMNTAGGFELDASIMDGRTRGCGAVAAVTNVKNPVVLARRVMTDTRHVLLAGSGAEEFARQAGVELVDSSYFYTEKAQRALERALRKRARRRSDEESADETKGTVGAVALDARGNLAAATSTGGMTAKQFGRVGDSPIIGAGTYAENGVVAVSCTGEGEEFIRYAVAYDLAARMKYLGASVEQAAEEIIDRVLKKNDGGLIALDSHGRCAMPFNTPAMGRASADSGGREYVALDQLQQ